MRYALVYVNSISIILSINSSMLSYLGFFHNELFINSHLFVLTEGVVSLLALTAQYMHTVFCICSTMICTQCWDLVDVYEHFCHLQLALIHSLPVYWDRQINGEILHK